VLLVCVNMSNQFYKITNPAVKVIDLGRKHIRSAAFAIFHLFRKEKPDLVFTNGQDLNLLMAMFKPVFGKKIRFICRETSVLSVNNKDIKYRKAYNISISKLYNTLDKIICQSPEMYADLVENYRVKPARLQVIPNPVAVPRKLDHQPRFKVAGELRLLSIARLVPEKGNLRLLQALALIKSPFRYIILGDGPQMEALQKEAQQSGIEDRVTFTGNVADTNDYIADCDFVLLGTYHEGFPNIVLEAGILGKPVIAFKAPGVTEDVIENEVTGLLVQSDSVRDFADAINRAQTIPFSKETIACRILDKFGIDKVMRDYDKLFDQVLRA
jgi:glycosyltransferase involved in cell wall biosynthesis